MPERLVIVEECFSGPGGRVFVAPKLTSPPDLRKPFAVVLRLPGGEERSATAALDFAHIQGPQPPFAMLRLVGVRAEEVPAGTEVWTA
jgi:hypothetical protein